jgi:hypothetical protein
MKFTCLIQFFWDYYILLAAICSLAYGFFAPQAFWNKDYREGYFKTFGVSGRVHQFWLNFVGSAAGWACLSVLRKVEIENISILHVLLIIIGLIGIIGHLPVTIIGLINALSTIVANVLKKYTE